jgi:hypothetical protein
MGSGQWAVGSARQQGSFGAASGRRPADGRGFAARKLRCRPPVTTGCEHFVAEVAGCGPFHSGGSGKVAHLEMKLC